MARKRRSLLGSKPKGDAGPGAAAVEEEEALSGDEAAASEAEAEAPVVAPAPAAPVVAAEVPVVAPAPEAPVAPEVAPAVAAESAEPALPARPPVPPLSTALSQPVRLGEVLTANAEDAAVSPAPVSAAPAKSATPAPAPSVGEQVAIDAKAALGSEFQDDGSDWFKMTGEPAPSRFKTEEPVVVRSAAPASSPAVWLGLLAVLLGLGALALVLILVAAFS